MTHKLKPYYAEIIFFSLSFLCFIYAWQSFSIYMDDYFITFRYADNLAQGQGFVFNQGDRVMGTTTPLLTLLLVPFLIMGLSAVKVCSFICALAIFGCSIIIYYFYKKQEQETVGLAAGLLIYFLPPLMQLWGNEVTLCLFFILAAIYFNSIEKTQLSAVFQALYILTRGEGVLFALLIQGYNAIRKKRLEIKPLATIVLLILPWFIFSWFYFGDLLPNSFYSKVRQGMRTEVFTPYYIILLHNIGRILWPGDMLLTILTWFGLVMMMQRKNFLLLGWIVLHQLAYCLLGVPGAYQWYFYSVWLLIPLSAGYGIYFISGSKGPLLSLSARHIIIYCLLLGAALFVNFRAPHYNSFYLNRYELYQQAIKYVKQTSQAGETILADEIGILGYFLNDYKFIDTSGLIHQDVPMERVFHTSYFVKRFEPEIIIRSIYPEMESSIERYKNDLVFRFPEVVFKHKLLKNYPSEKMIIFIYRRVM